jgi:hypothetical protein
MARIRTIKPEFFRHEELQDIEIANPGKYVMLVFAGLWGHCDSKGRFEYRPRQLKLDILPFLSFDMSETLQILCNSRLVERYEVAGKEYGFIPSFEKHQRLSGKESSEGEKYPSIEKADKEATGKQRGSNGEAVEKFKNFTNVQEREREEEGNRNMEMEGGCKGETMSDPEPEPHAEPPTKPKAARSRSLDCDNDQDFAEFWQQYPKRHGTDSKAAAYRCWAARIRDGCGPGTMILGAQRYAAHCDAKGITGTEYVMQAARFIGRDRHFENDWRKPNAPRSVYDVNDRPF